MSKRIKITIIVVTILLIICSINLYKNKLIQMIYPKKYSEYVEKYSKVYEVDSLLIYSIIKVESNFNEKAQSKSGAKGLMQLMSNTALEFAQFNENMSIEDEKDIFNSEKNIMLGTQYYSYLYKRYNENMLLALTAYNAGPGNVDKWIIDNVIKNDGSNIENIPFKETNMYVRKIVNCYKMYQKIYNKK